MNSSGSLRRLAAWSLGVGLLAGGGQAMAARIVVYGASGTIGSVIVQEALARGHTIIGVSRDPARLKVSNPHFSAAQGDVTDLESFRKLTDGADAVIISVAGSGKDNLPENSTHAVAAKIAVEAFSTPGPHPYVLEIGGATTLWESRDAVIAHLPPMAKPGTPMYGMFLGHLVALDTYRASHIRWTVLTPPMSILGWARGEAPQLQRTGHYRISTCGPVTDADGKSAVQLADLAMAAVDEVEHQYFSGRRFTVGY